ncbi:hypothetical protein EVAR_78165_1 [Eumeta japonica]|uniref:Uncharacterized protein n=1 Tax=Eumeta variegata TaxID=151549 RepID=A0A4C1UZZ9_EUMVA|nr:hypothetical protein EVAR_78165_1 [Eumeta japonica]
MESILQNAYSGGDDKEDLSNSKPSYMINKNHQDDKTKANQQTKEDKDSIDNIASIVRQYECKVYAEDETSQPTSGNAPIIPAEIMPHKKRKRRRPLLRKFKLHIRNCPAPGAWKRSSEELFAYSNFAACFLEMSFSKKIPNLPRLVADRSLHDG